MATRGQNQDQNQQQRGKRQDPGTFSPDDDEAQEIDRTTADPRKRRDQRGAQPTDQGRDEGSMESDEAGGDAADDEDDEDENESRS